MRNIVNRVFKTMSFFVFFFLFGNFFNGEWLLSILKITLAGKLDIVFMMFDRIEISAVRRVFGTRYSIHIVMLGVHLGVYVDLHRMRFRYVVDHSRDIFFAG